jgi:hypothetical protein
VTQAPPRRPWSLARLSCACRAAAVVWLALCEFAEAGSGYVVCPTRETLSRKAGVASLKGVSHALVTLHRARWIRLRHATRTDSAGRTIGKTLKIALIRGTVFHSVGGRKIALRCAEFHSVEGRKIAHDSLTERAATSAGACGAAGRAGNGNNNNPQAAPDEHTRRLRTPEELGCREASK